MTFTFTFHFSLSCIGEGNGNPLQCSCLKNPRDGGAWWAAVYGVTQSRTRLTQLSSVACGILVSQSAHVARLEFPRETGLILRCAGKAGNPYQTTQGLVGYSPWGHKESGTAE